MLSDRVELPSPSRAAVERREKGAPLAKKDQGPEPGKPLAGKTVLIVEDDFLIGMDIANFVESLGATVLGPAASTAAARAAIEGSDCDGAVLDVNLGRETSFGLARELLDKHVPFIFVTAYADDDALFEPRLAAAPRIGKPISRASLARKAAELFGGRRFDA